MTPKGWEGGSVRMKCSVRHEIVVNYLSGEFWCGDILLRHLFDLHVPDLVMALLKRF